MYNYQVTKLKELAGTDISLNELAKKIGLTKTHLVTLITFSDEKYDFHKNLKRFKIPTLKNHHRVTNIFDLEVLNIYEDDHLPCVDIVFLDQNHNIRYAEINHNELGPGMCEYYTESPTAKSDLLDAINGYMQYQREQDDERFKDISSLITDDFIQDICDNINNT